MVLCVLVRTLRTWVSNSSRQNWNPRHYFVFGLIFLLRIPIFFSHQTMLKICTEYTKILKIRSTIFVEDTSRMGLYGPLAVHPKVNSRCTLQQKTIIKQNSNMDFNSSNLINLTGLSYLFYFLEELRTL